MLCLGSGELSLKCRSHRWHRERIREIGVLVNDHGSVLSVRPVTTGSRRSEYVDHSPHFVTKIADG